MVTGEEKQRAPAFQFFPRQFAADDHVMAMDLDAVGAHILLMCVPQHHRKATEFLPKSVPFGLGFAIPHRRTGTVSRVNCSRAHGRLPKTAGGGNKTDCAEHSRNKGSLVHTNSRGRDHDTGRIPEKVC